MTLKEANFFNFSFDKDDIYILAALAEEEADEDEVDGFKDVVEVNPRLFSVFTYLY